MYPSILYYVALLHKFITLILTLFHVGTFLGCDVKQMSDIVDIAVSAGSFKTLVEGSPIKIDCSDLGFE
jgi:hypothetical protein